jgi:hypothetical protein
LGPTGTASSRSSSGFADVGLDGRWNYDDVVEDLTPFPFLCFSSIIFHKSFKCWRTKIAFRIFPFKPFDEIKLKGLGNQKSSRKPPTRTEFVSAFFLR